MVRTTGRPEALAFPCVRSWPRSTASYSWAPLLLAAVGIYGVMSYSVLERVREVGVRVAIGASPADIVRLVLREGLVLGLVGIGIGVIVFTFAAGFLRSILFEAAPRDPASLAAVSVLLLLATLTAAWFRPSAASRVDPTKALRTE